MQTQRKILPSTLRMILVLTVLGVALAWFLSSQMQPLPHGLQPTLPSTLYLATGETIDTHVFLGKPLVVNFWGTWCPPCVYETPALVSVAKKFEGRVGFLGLAVDSPRADILNFQSRFQIPYPLAIADMHILAQWKAEQLPMTYLLDKNGLIVWSHRGAASESELTHQIQRVVELIGIEPTTS